MLQRHALASCPYLSADKAPDLRLWMGHRPSTPDGLPVIGPLSRYPRLIAAFGHGHIGIAAAQNDGSGARCAGKPYLRRRVALLTEPLRAIAVSRFSARIWRTSRLMSDVRQRYGQRLFLRVKWSSTAPPEASILTAVAA
ncbi:FAD-dependent oxidoreductase [Rhizobium mongolense]|uniref:FAD-dependent oxidoreductase n=1 Tax=Rhizobium mongolense TaxID=57676 RepID=UPI0034A57F42